MKNKNLKTVKDIILELQKLPPKLPLLINGYETGYDSDFNVKTILLEKNLDNPKNYWDGDYDEAEKSSGKHLIKAVVFERIITLNSY